MLHRSTRDNPVHTVCATGQRLLPIAFVLAVIAFLLPAHAAVQGKGNASPQNAPSGAATEAIAYVNSTTGDEIRLVAPDGSNDRRLWGHGRADAQGELEVWSLAWREDAAALAFASTHEKDCSVHFADIYALPLVGGAVRRVTEAPACSALSGYGQGTVRVPVENNSIFNESVNTVLYFQGAPGPKEVSLAPGASTVVIFEDVADLGGQLQYAVEGGGADRWVHASSGIDVQAGATVETATVYVPGGVVGGHEARWPTWRADGGAIGYVTGFNSVRYIDPQPAPLTPGDPLLTASASEMPDFVDHLTWGPPGARANQLLYASYEAFETTAIYLATAGSSSPGQAVVSFDASTFVHFILGIAWLPDGSGFVYSVLEDDFYTPVSANIYAYDFASGQSTAVTSFDDEFAGMLSVSPDGESIVFERGATWSSDALRVQNPQLWVIDRGGSNARLLVAAGRAPAWSPQALPEPPQFDHFSFLPAVMGN